MSVLQWALLILGAVAVIAVYVVSRREKAPPKKSWIPPMEDNSRLPAAEQAELFGAGKFDEFGVGKARKRTAPMLQSQDDEQGDFAPPPAPAPVAPPLATGRRAPSFEREPAPAPAATPPPVRAEEKIIALLIAEREGTAILGPKLHAALQSQKLQFGERQIYHRMEQGMIVFSVASLLKPGALDPAQSASFETPGLSVFMVLPGPVKPVAAFNDMVSTARALAKALNADVYDARRQPFTADSERAQKAEVESWARSNHLA
mgnify:CR=1 FL=1